MLLEFAIGDAYGRTFEFASKEFIKEHNDIKGYKHREGEIMDGIGIYTDDTQMSLGVAELLLSGAPTTQIRYAHHFLDAYKRDPRGGYSRRIRAALEDSNPRFPFEFLLKTKPAGFKSNGSVMRTMAIGLTPNTDEIIHNCMVHTSTSHGSMEALNATVAIALTVHYLYYIHKANGNPVKDVSDYQTWMKEKMGASYDTVMDSYDDGELPCDGMKSAASAIRMVWEYDDLGFMLFKSIEKGGDVDTLAALSLGLGSLKGAKPLAPIFYTDLENGKYGKDYIVELDKMLFDKYPKVQEKNEILL